MGLMTAVLRSDIQDARDILCREPFNVLPENIYQSWSAGRPHLMILVAPGQGLAVASALDERRANITLPIRIEERVYESVTA